MCHTCVPPYPISLIISVNEVFVVVKVKLTIIYDADHYPITGDVTAPNWHHIQVKPTGVVLALCKLNTHPHTTLLTQLKKV